MNKNEPRKLKWAPWQTPALFALILAFILVRIVDFFTSGNIEVLLDITSLVIIGIAIILVLKSKKVTEERSDQENKLKQVLSVISLVLISAVWVYVLIITGGIFISGKAGLSHIIISILLIALVPFMLVPGYRLLIFGKKIRPKEAERAHLAFWALILIRIVLMAAIIVAAYIAAVNSL